MATYISAAEKRLSPDWKQVTVRGKKVWRKTAAAKKRDAAARKKATKRAATAKKPTAKKAAVSKTAAARHPECVSLTGMTVAKLRYAAKELGIKGYSTMKKNELCAAIKRQQRSGVKMTYGKVKKPLPALPKRKAGPALPPGWGTGPQLPTGYAGPQMPVRVERV